MKRYILTGAPGSGKTTLLKALGARGYICVEEAATSLIEVAQSVGAHQKLWEHPDFIDMVLGLQAQLEREADQAARAGGEGAGATEGIMLLDRSPICTYALSRYLGRADSPLLLETLQHIQDTRPYDTTVFFLENLGFVENTQVRQLSQKQALAFEKIHHQVYEEQGFRCVKIPALSVEKRLEWILRAIA